MIAETDAQAADAVELVDIAYDDLPPVIGFDWALARARRWSMTKSPGNVMLRLRLWRRTAATAAASPRPHMSSRLTAESPRVAPVPMEPRAVLAAFNAGTGRYEIRCSHQGAGGMGGGPGGHARRGAVRRARGTGSMLAAPSGRAASPYAEYAVLLHMARRLGRPIKWVASRSEDFATDSHGRAIRLTGGTGVGRGRPLPRTAHALALRRRRLPDRRRSIDQHHPWPAHRRRALPHAGDVWTASPDDDQHYPDERLSWRRSAGGRLYLSSAWSMKLPRPLGSIRWNCAGATRCPRRRCHIRTPAGSEFDSGDFPDCSRPRPAESAWSNFPERRTKSADAGRLRGIGCALFLEPAGAGAAPNDEAAIHFREVGRRISTSRHSPAARATRPCSLNSWPTGLASIPSSRSCGERSRRTEAHWQRRVRVAHRHDARQCARERLRDGDREGTAARGRPARSSQGRHRIQRRDLPRGRNRPDRRAQGVDRRARDAAPHPLDTLVRLADHRNFPSGAHVAEVEIDPETGHDRRWSPIRRWTTSARSSIPRSPRASSWAGSCKAPAKCLGSTASTTRAGSC